MYKYNVSVVMAVYNVEPFIREAIDSVIEQDIGFRNIQLILVNDGSPDGSGAICDEYAAKYPENIVVVHKENGGVSSARNAGLDLVEGEFVNFMDPDDKLSQNAVSSAVSFFEKYGDATDVASFPMKFFDGQKGEHTLNYKYNNGTRVIDLEKEWENPQCSMSSTFVRASCFDNLRFDRRIAQAEDLHLMQRILLKKRTMGVLSDTAYWYRKRTVGELSAIQTRAMNKSGYIPMMKYVQMDTVNFCLENYHEVPKFIQFVLMYDNQWQIRRECIPDGVLTALEKQEYFTLIHTVLQYIEDDVIDAQRNLSWSQKVFAYRLKYEHALIRHIGTDDICLRAEEKVLFRASESPVKLEFYENRGDSCKLEGLFCMIPEVLQNGRILVKAGEHFYEACECGTRNPEIRMEQEITHYLTFRFDIPLEFGKPYELAFYFETEGIRIPLRVLHYGRYFPISSKYKKNFYATQDWILTQTKDNLLLSPRRAGAFLRHELLLCWELFASKHKIARNSVVSRLLLHILKPFKRKPIWLISDRASKAGDNGEAFFRYIRKNHPEIDARFVINGDCEDYVAMQKIGPVVKKNGIAHKILHLLSDCIISSHGEADIYNPFYRCYEPYRNLIADDKYVFLQHGVIQNDLSAWLRRSNKNFVGFVTTALPEYHSILDGDYGYTEKEVWLTGAPRYDRLYQQSEKWVTIMPTWRKYLVGTYDECTGKWNLASNSANSEYIHFYNSLLNDTRLHESARKHGYQIKFVPHPNMQLFLDVFDRNEAVEYIGNQVVYRDVYAKSDLVITDYSSAAFDFAYLRKPLLYTQFDVEDFFSGSHTVAKGYFDYERDGFGEVEQNLDSAVNRIVEYMESGCQLKEEYRQRIEKFFAFNDQNNCQRIFDKIMAM